MDEAIQAERLANAQREADLEAEYEERSVSSKNNRIMREAIECVRIAQQLALRVSDWEVEIDRKMVSTYDILSQFNRCLKTASDAGIPVESPDAEGRG